MGSLWDFVSARMEREKVSIMVPKCGPNGNSLVCEKLGRETTIVSHFSLLTEMCF